MTTLAMDFKQGDQKWHALRKRCREDLYWFADVVLGYGEKIPMRPGPHGALCRVVERRTGSPLIDDARYRKITMPRETGKTTLVTQGYVIQRIIKNREVAIQLCNEKEQTAKDILSAVKHEFEHNELLRALFPEVIPPDFNDTVWSASRIIVNRTSGRKEPTVYVTGVGGTVTGMHPDVILVDDMISREAMENARSGNWQIMHQTNRWINQLDPLLKKDGIEPEITFIGTKWWHKDSYDHIDKAFGNGEPPRNVIVRMPLPDSNTVQQVLVQRVGDLVIFNRSAIEDGRSIFPEKWSLEDLAKIRVRDPALFACFPPDQGVITQRGHTPIAEVQAGDLVRGIDGEWTPVQTVLAKPWRESLRSIRLWGTARPFHATADHRLWASKAVRYRRHLVAPGSRPVDGSGKPQHRALPSASWTEAGALTVGDVLWTPINRREEWPVHWPTELRHPDVWFLIGHWLGDGSISTNRRYPNAHSISHVFNHKEIALAERVQGIIRQHLRRKANFSPSPDTQRLGYGHAVLGPFFKSLRLGKNSHKLLPAWAESIPLDCQRALIDGYWSADGCMTARGHLVAVSVCLPLLEQFQRILARLGEVSYTARVGVNQKRGCRIHGKVYPAQQAYALSRYPNAGSRVRKVWIDGDWFCRRVRAVEERPYSGPVFTLEAAGTYTLAGNVVAKNCNYMNNPADEVTAVLKADWLRSFAWLDDRSFYYTNEAAERKVARLDDLDILFLVDPGGFGEKLSEDRARAAICVVGDDLNGHVFFLDCYCEQDTYLACIRQAVAFAQRYQPRKIYVERAGQQAAFAQLLREHLRAAEVQIVVDDTTIKPGQQQKDVRILEMEPTYQQGQFYVPTGPQFLEFHQQYAQFPRGGRVDVLDILGYLPRLRRRTNAGRTKRPEVRQAEERATFRARMARR